MATVDARPAIAAGGGTFRTITAAVAAPGAVTDVGGGDWQVAFRRRS